MRKWQLHEVEFVRRSLDVMPYSEIAVYLDRSRASVCNLVSRLDDAKRQAPRGTVLSFDHRHCRWKLRQSHPKSAKTYCLKATEFGFCYCRDHLRRINLYRVHSTDR